jgi:predicted DNA-binding transcriptional regulator YafY
MEKGKQDIIEVLYTGLTIVNTLLQHAGQKLTRRQLADKTGVRPKQVWRYLNTLEALLFPLHRELRSQEELVWVPHEVPAGHKWLRLMPFTGEELTALAFYASLSHALDGTCLHDHVQAVRDKIARLLRQEDKGPLTPCFIDFAKHVKSYQAPAVQKKLALVLAAIAESLPCRVTYRRPHALRARTYLMHPYTLCEYDGGLYLFAYVPHRDSVIVQSLERIQYVAVLDASPVPKKAEVWQRIEAMRERAFGILDDGEVLDVVLKFSPAQAPYVRERQWHPTQQLETQPDGSLLLRFQASGRFEIQRWIQGWGEQVEVLGPPSLRRDVVAHLRAAAAQYAPVGLPGQAE